MRLLIFGDSWSYHSYKKQDGKTEIYDSLNFQNLFSNIGIDCKNFSIPGGSNTDTITQIKKNIDFVSSVNLVIVFQTDVIRQFFNNSDKNLELINQHTMPKALNFDHFQELLCKEFYNELSILQSTTQIPFLLVGGCSKLHARAIPQNLDYLQNSWSELIEPNNFHDCFEYWIDPSITLFNYLQHKYNWPGGLAEFAPIEQRILVKNYLWQTNDNFGWCHPADGGYLIMFDRLIEKIHNIGVLNEHHSQTSS